MRKSILVIVQTFMLLWLLIPSLAGADANTVLLLHGDGTGNSFADSSASAHPLTAVGNATQSTAQNKFGGSSMHFDGNGDYLSLPTAGGNFDFASGNFTLEAWVYQTSNVGFDLIFTTASAVDASGVWFGMGVNNYQFAYSQGGTWIAHNFGSLTTNLNKWVHHAIVRDSGTIYMYVDGAEIGAFTISGAIDAASAEAGVGGRAIGGDNFFDGFIDEVRISKGIARYTTNFTPPTAPHVLDSSPPVITLLGNASETVEHGTTYTDAGATATDDVDGVITGNMASTGLPVDTNTLGAKTITYNVSDAAGNAAVQVTRTVTVVDTTAPVCSLVGSATVNVFVGSTYSDAGATASDNVDGDISGSITATGLPVNTSTAGTFTITYNVLDSSGNAATQIIRMVTVVDPSAISCSPPGPVQVDETGTLTPVTLGSASALGGEGAATATNDAPANNLFPAGLTIVSWTVTDSIGQSDSCTQNITVNSVGGGGETRYPITSLPFTITGPGSYYFPGNLTFTGTSGSALTVSGSGVTIDLNDYSLIGPGIGACVCHGVSTGGYDNVEIANGTIKDFGGNGIYEESTTSSGVRVKKVRSHSNGLAGVHLNGNNHSVTRSTSYNNGGTGVNLPGTGNRLTRLNVYGNSAGGINTGSASTVNHNMVTGNTGTGISGNSGNNYSRNTVYGNTGKGMSGGSGNSYNNNTVYSNSESGLLAGVGAIVKGNICYSNGNSGINASNGSMVSNNTVYLNNTGNSSSHAGIVVTGNTMIKCNTLSLNLIQNIHVSGDGNVIQDNTVNASGIGINFSSGTNFYSGNRASGNSTGSYVLSAVPVDGGGNVVIVP